MWGDLPPALTRAGVLATGKSIARMQERSGAIAWPDGHVDAGDHVECAMALSACGLRSRPGGPTGGCARPSAPTARGPVRSRPAATPGGESHHAAYVAVGAWHEYQVTGDERHALAMWPTVRGAVQRALGLRTPRGEVRWERDAAGVPETYALLSGRASIHLSLRCAVALAKLADDPRPELMARPGRHQLGAPGGPAPGGVRGQEPGPPWTGTTRCSAEPSAARTRTAGSRRPGVRSWPRVSGVRCVSDEQWVTAAETCELVIALEACGMCVGGRGGVRAERFIPAAPGRLRLGRAGSSPTRRRSLRERRSWTAAAVVLAADALTGFSGGAGIFRDAADQAGQPGDRTACGCQLEPGRAC